MVQARTAKDHKNVEVDIDAVKPEPVGENKNFPDFLVNYDAGLSALFAKQQGAI